MKSNYLLIFTLILLIFSGCRKNFEFEDIDYTTYNRLVGPDGGTINYFANYDNDSKNDLLLSLQVPKGALDSLMVFNMYEFEDYEVATQMENNGFTKFGSKLLYFVPFYESEGYKERGQLELNYHLSIKFKQPVTVTYHPLADFTDLSLKNWQEVELYNNYYKTTNRSYKVYRIKIPRLDQWGGSHNIFVNWTRQGYANGYDKTDLSYIINGRWTSSDNWGFGEISMENWELVGQYDLDTEKDQVSFKIFDTDYIYVVARDIFIANADIPLLVSDYVNQNLGLQILRAAYVDDLYKVYLSDESVAVFDQGQNFNYLLKENLFYSDLPGPAQGYIKSTFPTAEVKKVSSKYDYQLTYEVVLSGGKRVTFDSNGAFISLSQYGFDPKSLPAQIKDYLLKNYPNDIITNVNYDYNYGDYYTVYLSSNVKVFFYTDFNGLSTWDRTLYYKMSYKNLPSNTLDFFSKNFPNAIFSEINLTTYSYDSIYQVELVDKKSFTFDGNGDLTGFEIKNFNESDLPAPVKNKLAADTTHIGSTITEITHKYQVYRDGQTFVSDYFIIYFSDRTYFYINADGTKKK
jgi:hypothetical protein